MAKTFKVIWNYVLPIIIISLIIPLIFNLMIFNNINWSNRGQIEYTDYIDSEYDLFVTTPQKIIRKNTDQYFSLLFLESVSFENKMVFSQSSNPLVWNDYLLLTSNHWSDLTGEDLIDFDVLNNGSIILSSLSLDIQNNYTLAFMKSEDGYNWNYSVSVVNLNIEMFNITLPYFHNINFNFGVFEYQNDIRFYTCFIKENQTKNNYEATLKIWSIDYISDEYELVEESSIFLNFYYLDFINVYSFDDSCVFLLRYYEESSNNDKLVLRFQNDSWAVNEIEGSICSPHIRLGEFNNNLFLIYTSTCCDNSLTMCIKRSDLYQPEQNSSYYLSKTENIAKVFAAKYYFSYSRIFENEDNQEIILVFRNKKPTYYRESFAFFLYEENYDSTQALELSFGIIGLVLAASLPFVIPVLLKKIKK